MHDYLPVLCPSLSTCDFLYITFSPAALPPNTFSPVALPCNRHLSLQEEFHPFHKKARKEVVSGSLHRLAAE